MSAHRACGPELMLLDFETEPCGREVLLREASRKLGREKFVQTMRVLRALARGLPPEPGIIGVIMDGLPSFRALMGQTLLRAMVEEAFL